jgi:uncharacterized Fe-S cluster-containing radical SAM superfamily protein
MSLFTGFLQSRSRRKLMNRPLDLDRERMSVFLTLQKNAGQTSNSYSRTVAVQKCGDPPYEIALRFGGCCLRCGGCFAAGYSWKDMYQGNPRVKSDVPKSKLISDFESLPVPDGGSYNWLRILGGEPLLNDEYIDYLFDFIIEISQRNPQLFKKGIVVQTNGIHVGSGKTSALASRLGELYEANPEILVAIETSIKGTNRKEFELLTRCDGSLFKYNINSYYELKRLRARNLRPVIIAGYGISESYLLTEGRGAKSLMTILYDDETPTYHPSIWSSEFEALYHDFLNDYKTFDTMFVRMPMYGLKDQFAYGWVRSAIKRGKSIYRDRWYDADYSRRRDSRVEKKFEDILEKFFMRSNQKYYSTLIRRSQS